MGTSYDLVQGVKIFTGAQRYALHPPQRVLKRELRLDALGFQFSYTNLVSVTSD